MAKFNDQSELYKLVCPFDLSIDIIRMTIGSEGRHFYRYTSEGKHKHIWCNKETKMLEITSYASFTSMISTMDKICSSVIDNIQTFEKRYSFIRKQDAKFIDDYNSGIISSKKEVFMISLEANQHVESNKLESEDQISILSMDSAIISSNDYETSDTRDTRDTLSTQKIDPEKEQAKRLGLINNKLDPNKTFADVLR